MKLYLAKPDLYHFNSYNDMMQEWSESGTQIAPWFLDRPIASIEDFYRFIRMLDNCEHGNTDKMYSSTTSYFVVDETDRLIGAASLRHYLTIEGYATWGHIGYGVRPTERQKGYATDILHMMLQEAKYKKIHRVLIGCNSSNRGSIRVIEHCNGVLDSIVKDPDNQNETINRYWINNY